MRAQPDPPHPLLVRAAAALQAGELSVAGWATLGLKLRRAEASWLGLSPPVIDDLAAAYVLLPDDATVGVPLLAPARVLAALAAGGLTPAGLQRLAGRLPVELADQLKDTALRRELVQRGLLSMAPPSVQPSATARAARPGTVMGVGPTRGRVEPDPPPPGAVAQGILGVGRGLLRAPQGVRPSSAPACPDEPTDGDLVDDALPFIDTDGFEPLPPADDAPAGTAPGPEAKTQRRSRGEHD